MNPKTRIKRIEMGVCLSCGGKLDTNGKWCNKCREKENEKSKLDRNFYLSNGICPYCRKEKIFKDEHACPECRAKRANIASKGREKHRIEYNANMRMSRSIQRKERKELQICTRCGKRKASINHSYCEQCLAKKREYDRKKREMKGIIVPRNERVANGLCYFCGNQIDTNGRTCKACA